MNHKILVPVSFGLLLSACGMQPTAPQANFQGCDQPANVPPCQHANPQNRLKINTKSAKLQATPVALCVDKDEPIVIEFEPPNNQQVLVAIIPKDKNDTWIYASGTTSAGSITLDPGSGESGHDYDYTILTSTGKCLDPRFHVD